MDILGTNVREDRPVHQDPIRRYPVLADHQLTVTYLGIDPPTYRQPFTDVSVGVYWILAVKSRLSQPDAFQTMSCRHLHER